ncbi:MAG: TadE/TadG family type IV pilus assembly protein, partial [Sphingobium sp.]
MARNKEAKKGFLARLLGNEAGNVLAMTAAAVFPLMGMVGGAVDMARLYAVKSRLQAACDAGALAGRRVMGNGAWADNSSAANTAAQKAFDLNFEGGTFGSDGLSRGFTENNGTVTGTASVNVPMTLMRLFGRATKNIAITCDGMMRIPNTDVMFVLDNSGSMAWTIPGDSSGQSRIAGLRVAVKCFYEALAKQDIDDVTPTECGTTSNPSGGLSNNVQLRFGFVNYDHMVNVGKLLPNDYIADSANYQSRITEQDPSNPTSTTYGNWSFSYGSKYQSNYQNNAGSCTAASPTTVTGTPTTSTSTDSMGNTVTTTTTTRTTNGTEIVCQPKSNGKYKKKSNGKYKKWTYQYTNYVESKSDVTGPNYTYRYTQRSLDVSGLKAGGSSWNSSVNLPIGWMNANTSVTWDGCIEERQTVANTDGNPSDDWDNFPSSPANAYDMDIDMAPSSGNPATQWKPALWGAVWARKSGGTNTTSDVYTTSTLSRNLNFYNCGVTPSRKLTQYSGTSGAANLRDYVNTMVPNGNTYHDIGLIWGGRLMSPTGIFG